jgi:mono/diheme cytochrome c family protein
MFRRVVNVIEVLVAVGVVVFVVALFANEPGSGSAAGSNSPGARLFAANCASCHGADGGGGVGPQLSHGAVYERFPNVNDQIRFVTKGRGSMPAFGGRLSPKQIQQVVAYTRTL